MPARRGPWLLRVAQRCGGAPAPGTGATGTLGTEPASRVPARVLAFASMSAMPTTLRPVAVALVACIVLAACGAGPDGDRALALSDCRLPRLAVAARCGHVDVPEDRAKPDGRTISIHVAVLAANTRSPDPDPFVILAGGPGQAASDLAPFAARLAEIRRTRDVVLVDQRGTGRSSPLVCAAYSESGMRAARRETDPVPRARTCVAELARAGIDPGRYTTAAFVADLEDVRRALGAARWNLWGGSYGTRVALEYLRRHPDRVRTLALDGVASPDMMISLDVWVTRERALVALFERCRATPACARTMPDPGAELDAVARNLGRTGGAVTIDDPATGAPFALPATRDLVIGLLQPLLYAPETTALIPAMIARAREGDYAPLVAAAGAFAGSVLQQLNLPLHYSVTCAEDASRAGLGLREHALAGTRSARLARKALGVCDVWPAGAAPVDAHSPVRSDVPALIFSGGMDPVTPPANGEEVAKTLAHARHVVAPGYGHIVSPHACGPRLLASFVEHAGFARLPSDCLAQFETSVPPALWTGVQGPASP